MKKFFFLIAINLTFSAYSQVFEIGIRVQKTHSMYWENGITLHYSFKNFAQQHFDLGFHYFTSRLGSAIGSNAIKQDNYLISGTWVFDIPKKLKRIKYYTRLNTGYFYSNLEEDFFEDIPNTDFLFSPETGVIYTFNKVPVRINLGLGYTISFKKKGYSPGTLQPLYYHVDFCYQIFKLQTNE